MDPGTLNRIQPRLFEVHYKDVYTKQNTQNTQNRTQLNNKMEVRIEFQNS